MWTGCVSVITKDHPSVLGDGNNFLLAKTSGAAKTKIPAFISQTEVWPEMLTESKFHSTCWDFIAILSWSFWKPLTCNYHVRIKYRVKSIHCPVALLLRSQASVWLTVKELKVPEKRKKNPQKTELGSFSILITLTSCCSSESRNIWMSLALLLRSSICIPIILCSHCSWMMPLRKSLHSTMEAIFCSPSVWSYR